MANNSFGIADADWDRAKAEIRTVLIQRAKVRGMIPYSELVTKIRAVAFDAYDQRLFWILGELSEDEATASRGMLSALVVHKVGDMEPGPGFFKLAADLGRDTSDQTKCWVDEIKLIYTIWSK